MHDPLEKRLTVLDAEPDSCSLTCGTTNFGDDVFLNPWGFMSDLYVQAQEREVVPEFELFDLGHVHALRRLLDTHGLPFGGRVHVDFVTNVPGGMPGTPAALQAALPCCRRGGDELVRNRDRPRPPADHGRGARRRGPSARGDGGQRRVRRGVPVQHNRELVERAAHLAEVMQRPAMSTEDARALLGVKDRRG